MADDIQTPSFDYVSLTADIVSAYVSNNSVPMADIRGVIEAVHTSLSHLGSPPPSEPEKLTPPVPIRRTVTPDAIISLEDGKPYKTLKRHLAGRGLTPEQYRQKWGLPPDYPMVASNYAAQRSELARTSGLGQRRRGQGAADPAESEPEPVEAAPAQPEPAPEETPAPRRRRKPAS
ncbi:MucR family transcriptional regulator [uncultured Methylobacterium sp.]|jgi:predicted transcriptional regulator|uniref:MucR family transcriptional regulator n=1 Tax=uncultured Methylobacterium sp. TaxID=157278 RepID=UPI00262A91EE|nr:MucR family transcriptional regulator [uncultured Methylobacterium sp.]